MCYCIPFPNILVGIIAFMFSKVVLYIFWVFFSPQIYDVSLWLILKNCIHLKQLLKKKIQDISVTSESSPCFPTLWVTIVLISIAKT